MEQGPTDKFPKPGEISWHGITLNMVQEKIDQDELEAARILANARIEGVQAAIKDIEVELRNKEGIIGPTSWEQEKALLDQDILDLQAILATIEPDTRD